MTTKLSINETREDLAYFLSIIKFDNTLAKSIENHCMNLKSCESSKEEEEDSTVEVNLYGSGS